MAKSKGIGSSGSVGLGANMETMRYQNQAVLPNQNDNDAQLFADIGKGLSAPGDRPRGAWRNLAAGVSKGLEYGAKSNAIGERKENYDKYEKVMDYFQQTNNAVVERNEWYEKRENARQKLMPQALAYMDNIDKLNPQSQRIMAQDMLAQYGEAIGEDFKLSSVDGSNPFLMTIQSSKGQQVFDLRSLFAGDEAMQQGIAMKMPGYQMKLEKEENEKRKKFDLEQEKIDILKYKEGVSGGKYGSKNDAEHNEHGSVPLETLKKGGGGRALINTVNSEINLAKDIPIVLEQLDEAEKIINDNPKIGSGWNNYASKGATTKTFMDDKLRVAYEKLSKIASRVEEAYVKAKGSNITDAERETIRKGLFDTTLKGESSRYNINSIRHELAIAQERGDFASEELSKGRIATSTSFNNFRKSKLEKTNESTEGDDLWNEIGKSLQ
jgi:hypothetical protein